MTPDITQRPTRLFLLSLVAVTAIGPLSMQIFIPALPIIQRDFGVAAGTAQLALSLSMVAIAFATLAYGPLSDRYGRRPVLIGGLLVYLLGSLICSLAADMAWLIQGRILQAAGGAAGIVLARAIVRDVYAHEQVASAIAYLTMAMIVAPMVAPAIGGVLTELMGWRAIFVSVGAIGLPVLALVLLRLAETNSQPARHRGLTGMLEGFALLLRAPLFCGYALNGAFAMAAFFAFAAGAPYLMVNVMGRPVSEYGLYFIAVSGAFMVGNFAAARLSRRIGGDSMIIAGSAFGLAAILVGALLAAGHVWTAPAIFGPMIAIAFGNGLTMPNAQAAALAVLPRSAGTASGLSGFLQMGISAIFAQAVGSLQGDSPTVMVAFMAAGLGLSILSVMLGLRYGRARVTAAGGD
jgi:DHA1 family bicyclomycin/chloramphenicol resistance-like MFS transporter